MIRPDTRYYRTVPDHPVVRSLTAGVQILLTFFFQHCNKHTGQLNPSLSLLADETRTSYSTVQRNLRVLRDAGIIYAIKKRRAWSYQIRPSAEWRRPPATPSKSVTKQCRRVTCDASYLTGQEPNILIERETHLLKEEAAAAVKTISLLRQEHASRDRSETHNTGGGGSSATPLQHKHTSSPVPSPVPSPTPPAQMGTELPTPEVVDEAQALVFELIKTHPTPGNISRAFDEIARALAGGAKAEEIRASHERWREIWRRYQPGRFIPQLFRWMKDLDWRCPPPLTQEEKDRKAQQARDAEMADPRKRYDWIWDQIAKYPWKFKDYEAEILEFNKQFEAAAAS